MGQKYTISKIVKTSRLVVISAVGRGANSPDDLRQSCILGHARIREEVASDSLSPEYLVLANYSTVTFGGEILRSDGLGAKPAGREAQLLSPIRRFRLAVPGNHEVIVNDVSRPPRCESEYSSRRRRDMLRVTKNGGRWHLVQPSNKNDRRYRI